MSRTFTHDATALAVRHAVLQRSQSVGVISRSVGSVCAGTGNWSCCLSAAAPPSGPTICLRTALPTLGMPMLRGILYPKPRPNSTICSWAASRAPSRATMSRAWTPAERRLLHYSSFNKHSVCAEICCTVCACILAVNPTVRQKIHPVPVTKGLKPHAVSWVCLPDCCRSSDSFSRVITSSSSPSEKITRT